MNRVLCRWQAERHRTRPTRGDDTARSSRLSTPLVTRRRAQPQARTQPCVRDPTFGLHEIPTAANQPRRPSSGILKTPDDPQDSHFLRSAWRPVPRPTPFFFLASGPSPTKSTKLLDASSPLADAREVHASGRKMSTGWPKCRDAMGLSFRVVDERTRRRLPLRIRESCQHDASTCFRFPRLRCNCLLLAARHASPLATLRCSRNLESVGL